MKLPKKTDFSKYLMNKFIRMLILMLMMMTMTAIHTVAAANNIY